MRSVKIFGFGAIVLLAGAILVEQARFDASRQTTMGAIDPSKVALEPAPIRPEWIIEGQPVTQAGEVAHTDDATTKVYVWQTSAARFHWNYEFDEVITILDGEVFVADVGGTERRLGPGDVAFFPFGAQTLWRVPDHVKKVAVVKRPMPGPFTTVMRWARTAKAWVKPTPAFAAN